MTTLESRYRRLLWAYPRGWRRAYGVEIVTTLLELADDGQSRPHRAEAWHLIRGGVRARLRVGRGRPFALAGVVLATVLLAAFGAAAGSWAGWQAAPALPTPAEQDRLSQAVAGVSPDGRYGVDSGAPWFGSAASLSTVTSAATRTPQQIADAMAADGWHPSGVTDLGDGSAARVTDSGDLVPIPSRLHRLVGERDGQQLQATALDAGDTQHVSLIVSAAEPAAVRPLAAAGLVLGGLAGWLVAAAGARGRRRTVTVLGTAALLALVLPAVAVYGNALRLLRSGPEFDLTPYVLHAALQPGRYYPPLPDWTVPALAVAGAVLGGAALLWAARNRATGPGVRQVAGA